MLRFKNVRIVWIEDARGRVETDPAIIPKIINIDNKSNNNNNTHDLTAVELAIQ